MDGEVVVCQCGCSWFFLWSASEQYLCRDCKTMIPLSHSERLAARKLRRKRDAKAHKMQFQNHHNK